MIKFLHACLSLFLILTVLVTDASAGTQRVENLNSSDSFQRHFKTYCTIFQDWQQPANLLSYPFNRECGWQPGTVTHNYMGAYSTQTSYAYDPYGNMIEYAFQRDEPVPMWKKEYTYNKSGHLISEIEFFKYYDDEGNPIDEWRSPYKKEYQYNGNGYLQTLAEISIDLSADEIVESTYLTEYEYDEIVKNYLTKTTYIRESNDNDPGNYDTGTETKIYRNANGNIVKRESYHYHAYGFDSYGIPDDLPDSYIVIEYDEKNVARAIKQYIDESTLQVEYSDIEWECTDGQILFDLEYIFPQDYGWITFDAPVFTNFDHNIKSFLTGLDMNNLIKSVTIKNHACTHELNTFRYEFDYPDYYGSYSCKVFYGDLLLTTYNFSILDSAGTFMSNSYYHNAYDWTEKEWVTYEGRRYCKEVLDFYGLNSSYHAGWGDPNDPDNREEDPLCYDNEIIYDIDTLLPIEYNYGYHRWDQDLFSDFFKVTASVDEVQEDDSPAQYFTIQGMPVKEDRLAPGIYIKVKKNKSEKIFIR